MSEVNVVLSDPTWYGGIEATVGVEEKEIKLAGYDSESVLGRLIFAVMNFIFEVINSIGYSFSCLRYDQFLKPDDVEDLASEASKSMFYVNSGKLENTLQEFAIARWGDEEGCRNVTCMLEEFRGSEPVEIKNFFIKFLEADFEAEEAEKEESVESVPLAEREVDLWWYETTWPFSWFFGSSKAAASPTVAAT